MRIRIVLICILFSLYALASGQQSVAYGFMYIGTWPNKIVVIDEGQGKIVDEIKLETGTPWELTVTPDKKTLVVLTTQLNVEVIDLATRKVVSHFSLNDGNSRVFPLGGALDPKGRYLYTTLRGATKEVDRYKLDKAKFAVIDLQEKKVVKTFDFPKEYDQGFGFLAGYKVS
ncbi:MAG TPA: hypothetical protein VKJ45_01240, partial [Blastocatellia bacterium]|nr:hypothetical protein [Blastocatellia bacterium]